MDEFEYLAALVSVVAGLSLARALSGVADILDSGRSLIQSDLHIVWTINVLMWLVGFWWFTFMLSSVDIWTVSLLLFVLLYGAVIYLLVALLHPNSKAEQAGATDNFIARRKPFFAAFLTLGLVDIADTLIKTEIYAIPGPPTKWYWALMVLWILFGAYAWRSASRTFHRLYAYCWLVIIATWNVSTLTSL
jgi:hypothetical protein